MFQSVEIPKRDHRRVSVRCECGAEVKGPAGLVGHRRGVVHLERTRLMDLLGCRVMGVTPLSFAEIGRRLGISRERVRQIAERLEAGGTAAWRRSRGGRSRTEESDDAGRENGTCA